MSDADVTGLQLDATPSQDVELTPERARAWSRELTEVAQSLTEGLRQSLAREWLRAASFEHASIASFNRFSLELLVLGAPADLVDRANRAALDEVRAHLAPFAQTSAASCSIRPQCSWHQQAGDAACAVCPLVTGEMMAVEEAIPPLPAALRA